MTMIGWRCRARSKFGFTPAKFAIISAKLSATNPRRSRITISDPHSSMSRPVRNRNMGRPKYAASKNGVRTSLRHERANAAAARLRQKLEEFRLAQCRERRELRMRAPVIVSWAAERSSRN